MKKVLATVLVLCMLLTCASFPAMAETTNPKRVKIFTMGDSFTAGICEPNAYRYYIYENLIQDGGVFEFIGPSTSGDWRVTDMYKKHGGVGGAVIGCADDYTWNGSSWVTNAWETVSNGITIKTNGNKNSIHYRLFAGSDGTNDYTKTEYGNYVADADIVVLYIGLNDYYSAGTTGLSADIEHVKNRYYTVVDRIYEINPDVSLYVCSLNVIDYLRGYNLSEGDDGYEHSVFKFNEFVLNDVVNKYTNQGKSITGVSLNQSGYEMIVGVDNPSDDAHPNEKGNRKIGTQIYNAIKDEVLELNEQTGETYNPTRVSSLTIDKTSATLKTGENLTITSTIAPSTAEVITTIFSSSDESVATVDGYGRITAVAPGTATIYATALDSMRPGATEISATCTVTVTDESYTKIGDNFLPVFTEDFAATSAWTGSTDNIKGKAYKHNETSSSSSITTKRSFDLKEGFSISFKAALMGGVTSEVNSANRSSQHVSVKVGNYELRLAVCGKAVSFYNNGTLVDERVFSVPVVRQNDDLYTLAKYQDKVYVYRNNELLFTSDVNEYDVAEGNVTISVAGTGSKNIRNLQVKSIYGLQQLSPTATNNGKDASAAVDSSTSTRYSIESGNSATAADWTSANNNVVLDLGAVYSVSDLNIYWGAYSSGAWGKTMPDAYNVSYSEDGVTYTPAKSYSGIHAYIMGEAEDTYTSDTTSFSAGHPSWTTGTDNTTYSYGVVKEAELGWQNVRYIKIEMTKVSYNPTIAEIEVFTTAYAPGESPDGTTSYTVNYVNKSGKALETPKIVGGVAIGEEVTETALEIDGYEVDKTSATITLEASGNVITFTYTRVYSSEPVKLAPIGVTSPFTAKSGYTLAGIIDGSEAANTNYFRASVNITSTGVKGNDNNLNFTADFGLPQNITSIYTAFGSKFATGVAVWGSNDNATWTELADLTLSAQRSTSDISHEGYYRYVKVEAYATNDSDPAILEVTFYGIVSPDYAKITGIAADDIAISGGSLYTNEGIGVIPDKASLVDGDVSNSTVNTFTFSWSSTAKTIEVTLPETATLSNLVLHWGNTKGADNAWNVRPAKTYEIFLAGEDGVYGSAVYSHDDTTLTDTPRGTNRTDFVTFATPVEGVKKIKVVVSNYYADGCLAIRELEAFEFIGSTEPETKTATYTVNYVDTEGDPVATAKNGTGNVGDVVTETAVAVDGYTVDKDSATITLIDGTNTITFTYTKVGTALPTAIAPVGATSKFEPLASQSCSHAALIDGYADTTAGHYFRASTTITSSGTKNSGGNLEFVIDLGFPYNLTEFYSMWGAKYATSVAIYGSNDQSTWTEIGDYTGIAAQDSTQTVEHTGYYRYIKVEAYKTQDNNPACLEVSFKGVLSPNYAKITGITADDIAVSGGTLYTDSNITPDKGSLVDGDISNSTVNTFTFGWSSTAKTFEITLPETTNVSNLLFLWGNTKGADNAWNVRPAKTYDVFFAGEDGVYGEAAYSHDDTTLTGTPRGTNRTDFVTFATPVEGVKKIKVVVSNYYADGCLAIRELEIYKAVGSTEPDEPDEPDTPVEPEKEPITLTPAGVSAPTNTSGRSFAFATDGDDTTFYANSSYRDNVTTVNDQFVFDIGYLGTVDSLDILWGASSWGNTTPDAYKVEVSSDGTTWTQKKSYSGIYDITTGAATDTISGENTVFGITTSSWAITNQPTQVNAYTQGNILEKNLGWTDVRYVRVTVTSVQYRLAISEVTISSLPNEDQIILSKGGQIRIADTDKNITAGLRFGASIIKMNTDIEGEYKYSEDAELKFGMFMLPADLLGSSATLTAYLANGVQDALDIPAEKIYSQDENFITFTAVLTGIPKESYDRDIVAVPYMLKGGEYTYFDEMTKSYKGVAEMALETTYNPNVISAMEDSEEKTALRQISYQLQYVQRGYDKPYTEQGERIIAKLKRGMNMQGLDASTWSSWDSHISTVTSSSTYQNIKNAGFDHVRIPVDFRNAADSNGNLDTSKMTTYVDKAVDAAIGQGLVVLLDFHGWADIMLEDFDYFVTVWTNLATYYKDKYPEDLIFELVNEPHTAEESDGDGGDLDLTNLVTLQTRTVEAIRAIDPDRFICLATSGWNGIWTLKDKDISSTSMFRNTPLMNYQDTIVALHCYTPGEFTHQDMSWAGTGGQTYSWSENQEAYEAAIKEELGYLVEFVEETGMFAILNEFGCNTGSSVSDEDEAAYAKAVVSCIKDNDKIAYTWWEYEQSFGMTSNGSWKNHILNEIMAD